LARGLTAARERQAADVDRRMRDIEAFERIRGLFGAIVWPVLSGAAEILREGGIDATVTEVIRDQPPRMRRCVQLVLCVGRVEGTGEAKLVITGIEGRDMIRTRIVVGPAYIGGPFTEGEAIEQMDALSEERVGELVATLAEMVFGSGR
jgi:hypothetical protein